VLVPPDAGFDSTTGGRGGSAGLGGAGTGGAGTSGGPAGGSAGINGSAGAGATSGAGGSAGSSGAAGSGGTVGSDAAADALAGGTSGTAGADASDGAPDTPLPCPIPGADPEHVYVDKSARADGNGTSDCPLRTISAGLLRLQSSKALSRTLHVAAGRYDAASGETFPLLITERMNIIGAGKGKTVVHGIGQYDHTPYGGSSANLHNALFVVRSEEPVLIRGLSLERAGDNESGIACLGGNAPQNDPPPEPFPEPNLIVDDVEVTGFYIGLEASNTRNTGCNARVMRSTLAENELAVLALGCGYARPAGGLVALELGTRPDGGNLIARSTNYTGVAIWGCVERLRVTGNEFRDNNVGLHIDEYTTYLSPKLLPVVTHNLFEGQLEAGLLLHTLATVAALEDNRFVENLAPATTSKVSAGVLLGPGSNMTTSPKILRARRNTFVGNDIGLLFGGNGLITDAVLDFGRPDDPGGNVFRCNGAPVPSRRGYDVLLGIGVPTGTVQPFAGNSWDHVPPTQAVGETANGTDLVIVNPVDWTVDMSGAQLATEACASGVAGP
jgi:hypothetical protein